MAVLPTRVTTTASCSSSTNTLTFKMLKLTELLLLLRLLLQLFFCYLLLFFLLLLLLHLLLLLLLFFELLKLVFGNAFCPDKSCKLFHSHAPFHCFPFVAAKRFCFLSATQNVQQQQQVKNACGLRLCLQLLKEYNNRPQKQGKIKEKCISIIRDYKYIIYYKLI